MHTDENRTRPVFSLVIPVWNEEAVLPVLYERIVQVLDSTGERWETIFVNDGSRDRTLPMLLELNASDPRIKVLNFSRNFGHQIAITAGCDYADGDAVIVMDADMQDPPEVILQMIARWREGYDVVYAVRTKREGESWFKLWTASVFYRTIRSLADIDIPLDAGDFRLAQRKRRRRLVGETIDDHAARQDDHPGHGIPLGPVEQGGLLPDPHHDILQRILGARVVSRQALADTE